MGKIITDASSSINEAILNKFLGAGESFIECNLFTMKFRVRNNAGTFQYQIQTNNTASTNATFLGALGVINHTTWTNVGDGIVTKTGVGAYQLALGAMVNLYALSGNIDSDDSNLIQARGSADATNNRIDFSYRNSSYALTDLATGKECNLEVIGFYKE